MRIVSSDNLFRIIISNDLRSGEVETIQVHDFVPRRDKVVQELLLEVLTCVDFRQCPELGVRTEDQVDTRAGPLEFANCWGWLTSQSFCGARRIRAPLAPPRLSEPQKVDADTQAVETISETDRPEARILPLREAISCASISW
jgi:hypothetical protein